MGQLDVLHLRTRHLWELVARSKSEWDIPLPYCYQGMINAGENLQCDSYRYFLHNSKASFNHDHPMYLRR